MEVFYKLILAIPLSTKKDAQRENCKLSFIWGKNEDCTPGQSTSHSSEKLFCRGPAPADPGYSKERRLGEGQGITA